MMTMWCQYPVGLAMALFLAGTGAADGKDRPDPLTGRTRLYTEPDPTCGGGIKGRVTRPRGPVQQVLAIPPDAPRFVYEGRVEGADRRTFRFAGLPMRKYDLLVIYEDSFYEGLQLQRGEDTLTAEDRAGIEAMIRKSEPYFPEKIIHRLEGTTGRGNHARCLCTFLREQGSDLLYNVGDGNWRREDHRRTFKLVMLKDVGPGWQVVRARDLYPVWVRPGRTRSAHHHRRQLSRIRVADGVKDLGELDLGH